jgi:hypothetical protein
MIVGIKIIPGQTAEAEKELWSFVCAYPVNLVGKDGDANLYWLPAGREDEAEMFNLMQYNRYMGTFDLLSVL